MLTAHPVRLPLAISLANVIFLVGGGVAFAVEPGMPATSATPLASLTGAGGLYRMSTAETGAALSLRLVLQTEYVRERNLLIDGDVTNRSGVVLGAGFTPRENVEIFAALPAARTRQRQPEIAVGSPTSVWSTLDLIGGSKLVAPLTSAAAMGFEVGFRVPLHAPFAPSRTSFWFAYLFLFDLRPAASLPWRWHLNAGFYADDSTMKVNFTGLSLATRQVESFSRGLGRDRLRFALGTDAPTIPSWGRHGLWPIAEYHLEIVTGDYDPSSGGQQPSNRDQHWLTLGLRARLNARLALNAGADVLIRSVGFGYGPPLPRLNLLAGISLAM